MENQQLIDLAIEAQQNSYSPYSNYKVGACLLASDGTIFKGCNIENASYGATNCAERTAIFKAVSEGVNSFKKIAVVGGDLTEFAYPCGICLQVLWEFMPAGTVVLLNKDGIKEFTVKELLPYGFEL